MISKLKAFKLMKWSNKHMCLLNFILFLLKKNTAKLHYLVLDGTLKTLRYPSIGDIKG